MSHLMKIQVVILSIIAAAAASTTVLAAVAATVATMDNRAFQSERKQKLSSRQGQWQQLRNHRHTSTGWYIRKFRCERRSFQKLKQLIESQWDYVHAPLKHNAHFSIEDRLAVTLHYLAHPGSLDDSATFVGMSKSSASRYIWQITAVINTRLKPAFVSMPKLKQEWDECKQSMFERARFPDAYLAIEGSLFEIERPYDFEGSFGKTIHQQLPADGHIVGDSGYTFFVHVMIPYPIHDNMPEKQKFYNNLHSKTRIVVEIPIGRVKGQFQQLKRTLDQKAHYKTDEDGDKVLI
ncbi:putative nuclease harbi1, partial [Chytriomyces hyalinus]